MINKLAIFIVIFLSFSNQILQKFNIYPVKWHLWFEKVKILYLGSNHPRRINLILYKLIPHKIFHFITSGINGDSQFIYDVPFINYVSVTDNVINDHIIFIGDSHVEFLSRSQIDFSIKQRSCSAIWLGPKTLLGFANSSNLEKDFEEILLLISSIIQKINDPRKRIHLIWCMGTIDVRFSIYELKLRGVIQSDCEIRDLFEDAATKLIINHLKKTPENLKFENIKLGFASCTNNIDEGLCPKSKLEVKVIRKHQKYPTFGTFEQRDIWTSIINSSIKKTCALYDFNYFDFSSNEPFSKRKNFFADNIHITCPSYLETVLTNYIRESYNNGRKTHS